MPPPHAPPGPRSARSCGRRGARRPSSVPPTSERAATPNCPKGRRKMCGFICFWNIGDAALAEKMIAKIAHRGPDEVHVTTLPGAPVTMAHCRLSIIGPEDGAQPIRQTDDMLVANGEIYNHADLR